MEINRTEANKTQQHGKKPDDKMAKLKETQQMFFKILAAQLKYQDMDNPVDANQMAQNVYQMNELQTLIGIDMKLDDMASMIQQTSSLSSASSMIGKHVVAKNSEFYVGNLDEAIPINYILSGNGEVAPHGIVRIMDSSGKIVHESHMENIQTNSMQTFSWNTKDNNFHPINPGTYRAVVYAGDEDKRIPAEIYTSARVQQALTDGTFVTNTGKKLSASEIVALQETSLPMNVTTEKMLKAYGGKVKQSVSDLFKNT